MRSQASASSRGLVAKGDEVRKKNFHSSSSSCLATPFSEHPFTYFGLLQQSLDNPLDI
jgi:hypothetical protein